MSDAPYEAYIHVDLHVWDIRDAQSVLTQLMEELRTARTEVNGGITTHHRVVGTQLAQKSS